MAILLGGRAPLGLSEADANELHRQQEARRRRPERRSSQLAASPASVAASRPIADQSSLSPPWASNVRNRSRRRLASGMGTRRSSAAASVRRISFWPSGAAKPAGSNFPSAISPP